MTARECRIDRIAAMMKVLSPISLTRITARLSHPERQSVTGSFGARFDTMNSKVEREKLNR